MCNEQLWSKALLHLSALTGHAYEFVHVKIPQNKDFNAISEFLNDYFNEEQVCIIGFSLGGYIAAHFAVTFPHRVSKFFVISNSGCALYPKEEQQRQQIVEFVSRYGYQGMSKARAEQLLDSKNTDQQVLARLTTTMLNMDAELGEAEFISQMRWTSERADLFEPLVRLKIPSVFYYSEADLLVNSLWLDKLQLNNEHCTMICTNGASHMLPLEKSEELAEHIHVWLKL